MANIIGANIPAFPNPGNPEHQIKLKEATVQQALQFSGLNPLMEEASLTAFLNEVQDPASYVDAKEWSAQSRKMAIFWYAVQTLDDAKMTADYLCDHCGEMHSYRYDLRSLADQFHTITGKPYREFDFNGETVRVSPINGEGMENLEQAKQGVIKPSSKESLNESSKEHNRKLLAHIRLRTLVLSIDYPNDLTEDKDERFKRKDEKITALTVGQYRQLEELVYNCHQELHHGLDMTADTDTGELYLVVGAHECPNLKGEGGEALTTSLRVPFRNYSNIPMV